EELAHRAARVRGNELHGRRIGSGRCDDDRIFERAVFFENLDELRNRRALLADGDVDAIELLVLVARGVDRFLIEDRIASDGGFAGLTVADDKLALAASNRDQGVDGLEAGLHRLFHAFARENAGRFHVDALFHIGLDRPFAVDRIAEAVDHAAEQAFAHRHFHDGAGPLDGVAFLNRPVFAKNNDADIVGCEVQRHAPDAAGKFNHFTGLDIVETINASDTVAHGEHLPDLRYFCFLTEIFDLLFEDRRNFRRADFHELHQLASFIAFSRFLSFVRKDVSIIWLPTFTMRPPSSLGSTVT